MANFGLFRGFSEKLFQGELPTNLGKIGSESFGFTGLLDDYPNSAAAYSLRLLRSAYTGSAIRVRESTNNTEQDIGFNALGGLDTSALTTFCGSGNGFVTTWYDQSGNARNATQSLALNQAQIVNSGSIITENSLPTLKFNSNQNYFTSNGVLNLSILDTYTILKSDSGASLSMAVFSLPESATAHVSPFARLWLFPRPDRNSTQIRQNGNPLEGTLLSNNVRYLVNLNSKNSIVYANNTSIITGKETTNLTYTNSVPLIIGSTAGATSYFFGTINELIIYPSDQSSNRTGISTNINTYYGIY